MALNKDITSYITNNFADGRKVRQLIEDRYLDRNPQWIKNALNLYGKKFANGEALTAEEELIVDASKSKSILSKDWFTDMDRKTCFYKMGPSYIPTTFGPDYIMYQKPSSQITNNTNIKDNYWFIHLTGGRFTADKPGRL